jgi:hypothetical protein
VVAVNGFDAHLDAFYDDAAFVTHTCARCGDDLPEDDEPELCALCEIAVDKVFGTAETMEEETAMTLMAARHRAARRQRNPALLFATGAVGLACVLVPLVTVWRG